MQLNSIDNIPQVANKAGFAIFDIPDGDFSEILPKCYHAKPNEKGIYAKEDIDQIAKLTQSKQQSDFTIVIENAEAMNLAAANTFLKTLEEPGDNIHFVFLVRNSSNLLPTIKSRAHNYYVKSTAKISDAPEFDADTIALAKKYIAATPQQLPKIAADIAKTKDDSREKAQRVVDAAIQLMYKSYFVTGNAQFLNKLDNLLRTQEALSANGHIKLQLVANML